MESDLLVPHAAENGAHASAARRCGNGCVTTTVARLGSMQPSPRTKRRPPQRSAGASWGRVPVELRAYPWPQEAPDQVLPDQVLPDQVLPDQVLPDQVLPDQVLPDQVLPFHMPPTHASPTREL
jgi:hypothetical protein